MTVLKSFSHAWTARRVVIPLFLAVRILSVAVIVPLVAVLVPLALSVSGQAALTDQDIAYFFLSPQGFVVFLGLAAILLIGSVIGLAAMTVNIHQASAGSLASLTQTLRLIGHRLPALISYAAQLTLRVLLIVLPFALAGLFIASRLISEFDINYYLSERPPEFVQAGLLIGSIVLVLIVVVLNRLLLWAVSLHLVLFDGVRPRQSFAESARRMQGRRIGLARAILGWFAVRAGLLVVAGAAFGFAMTMAVDGLGQALRAMLTMSLLIAALWAIVNFVISGVALGALARILDVFHSGADTPAQIWQPEAGGGLRLPIFALGLAGLLAVSLFVGSVIVNSVQSQTTVEVIAHRGAAGIRPENTIASVRQAVEDQADWVEIDVQETADGQIVVMHDSDFMKQAGVDLKVWDATIDDLAQIDIGSWFDPVYAAERPALLSDVLEITRDKSNLLIELKYYGHDVDLERRTIALVEAAGMADQVATMSLKYPAVQKMKGLRPDWTSGVLAATAIGDLSRLEADFIAVSTTIVGPRLVQAASSAGKKLYVWTVNDPIEMSAMMSLGVDGLITDEPALARAVMEFRAELTTPERVFLLLAEQFGLSITEDSFSSPVQ